MTIEQAMETPIKQTNKIYTYKGFSGTVGQISKEFNFDLSLLKSRLGNGKTIEEAMKMNESRITAFGKKYSTYKDLAEDYNINPQVLRKHLKNNNMPIEEAIKKCQENKEKFKRVFSVNDIYTCTINQEEFTGTIEEIAKKTNFDPIFLIDRLRKGYTIQRAIDSPLYIRKNSKIYVYKGEEGFLQELCEKNNKDFKLVSNRIQKGMTIEEAMEKPLNKNKSRNKDQKIYSYSGKLSDYKEITGTIHYISEKLNISHATVNSRMKRGLSLKEALELEISQKHKIKIVNYNGEDVPLVDLCEKLHINYSSTKSRIQRGFTLEEALSIPISKIKTNHIYKYKGKSGKIKELCKIFNKNFDIVYRKMKMDLSTFEYAMDSTDDPYIEISNISNNNINYND